MCLAEQVLLLPCKPSGAIQQPGALGGALALVEYVTPNVMQQIDQQVVPRKLRAECETATVNSSLAAIGTPPSRMRLSQEQA